MGIVIYLQVHLLIISVRWTYSTISVIFLQDVRNHVKLEGFSLTILYCVVDTGYGLGRSVGGLQTCIAERLKVPNS